MPQTSTESQPGAGPFGAHLLKSALATAATARQDAEAAAGHTSLPELMISSLGSIFNSILHVLPGDSPFIRYSFFGTTSLIPVSLPMVH